MKKYKAHPLEWAARMKPFLPFLFFPVIQAAWQQKEAKNPPSVFLGEIFVIVAITVMAYLYYISYEIVYENQYIVVKHGFFCQITQEIPCEKIVAIACKQTPADALCQAVSVRMYADGGKKKETVSARLRTEDAKQLLAEIFSQPTAEKITVPAYRAGVSAALLSSSIGGLAVAVPLLNRFGKLLGIALTDRALQQAEQTATRVPLFVPLIFRTAAVILAVGYIVSLVVSVLQSVGFQCQQTASEVRISYGFLIHRQFAVRKSAVMAISFEQNLLLWFFRFYRFRLTVSGMRQSRFAAPVFLPCVRAKEQLQILSRLFGTESFLKTELKSSFSFANWWINCRKWVLIFIGVKILCVVVWVLFPAAKPWMQTLFWLATVFLTAKIGLEGCALLFGFVSFGKNLSVWTTQGLHTVYWVCPYQNINVIRLAERRIGRRLRAFRIGFFFGQKQRMRCAVTCFEPNDFLRCLEAKHGKIQKE